MADGILVDPKLLEAFHLMYDNFPEPVQLAHKSLRIVAANAAAVSAGKCVGVICATVGPPEAHKGCLAAKAVKEQRAQWRFKEDDEGRSFSVFWLPVPGYPEFYVHFSAGRRMFYTE